MLCCFLFPRRSANKAAMHINLLHLGRVPYAEAMAIQQQVVSARKQDLIGDTLLLLEHPPVLTLGRNAHRSNVLVSDELLAQRGVELHEVNRGGDVTYHGPGQLVGYPIIDLRGDLPGKKGPYLGPVDYVRLLEEALIRTCGDFGVMTQRICKLTGVWTGDRCSRVATGPAKIAAIGVHLSRWVTSHGFALNVTTDLSYFQYIVPCGLNKPVTSMAALGVHASLNEVGRCLARHFARNFDCEMLLEAPVLAALESEN